MTLCQPRFLLLLLLLVLVLLLVLALTLVPVLVLVLLALALADLRRTLAVLWLGGQGARCSLLMEVTADHKSQARRPLEDKTGDMH